MSRRIDIELTSALPDNSWTWRAAGAKQPKGTLDGSLLSDGASVGDVIKVEVEQEIDGITVTSVVGGREKEARTDLIELLPTEREFQPVIETRAKRDRNERGGRGRDGGERRPRRDRDGAGRGRDERGGPGKRDDRGGRGGGGNERGDRNERGGRDRRGRGGPAFTPPPEVPQRPKPKRLKPGKANRSAILAELPEEQRSIAELALQGMGAVRQRLHEENAKAAAEGRALMPEASVLKIAEDLLPRFRAAEWRDRAEAALRQIEHLDLRDLRSVVTAASDPIVARDESTRALAAQLTEALATKQEQELRLWFGDVDAALAVGRVIRALRLSSQPPKAGVPFPTDIAQRLVDSANASLAPMDSAERWIAMLEAAAFSPVRTSIAPARKPDQVNDDLLATVKRLAPALPQVAALFDVEVDPKAPMPKPLRPGPRGGRKNERSGAAPRKDGRPDRERRPKRSGDAKPNKAKSAVTENKPDAAPTPSDDAPADDTPATDTPATDTPATDTPATDTPATDTPVTDAPVTDAPVTDTPSNDEPVVDEPAASEPVTEAVTEAVADEPAASADDRADESA